MTTEDQIREAHERRMQQNDKEQLRRSRITAFVLASTTVISLAFLVFAFTQKSKADQLERDLLQTKEALERCEADSE